MTDSSTDCLKDFAQHQLRFCPECVHEDQHAKPARHPYLRSLHQIPGYAICHRHQVWLQVLPDSGSSRFFGYSFDALNRLSSLSPASPPEIPAIAKTLADDIAAVPAVFKDVEAKQVWDAIADRLYSSAGLRKNLPKQVRLKVSRWVELVLGRRLAKNELELTPHRQTFRPSVCAIVLLLIRGSGETPKSFIELILSRRTKKLLRPCRNPRCEKFGQNVIEEQKKLLAGTGNYLFTCPECKFSYLLNSQQLRGTHPPLRVYSLADDEMMEFRRLWNDPGVSLQAIEKKYRLSGHAVLSMVHQQGMAVESKGRLVRVRSFLRAAQKNETILRADKQFLLAVFAKDPSRVGSPRRRTGKIIRALVRVRLRDPVWVKELVKKCKEKVQT